MMNLVLRSRNGFPLPLAFRRQPMERLLEGIAQSYFAPAARDASTTRAVPRINISESDKAYVVEAELPGVAKEDVKISVDGKLVTLEAEVKRESNRHEGETTVFSERTAEKFLRSFTLDVEVDDAGSAAKLENGILTLTLPKKEELRPKKILVQ